MAKKIVAVTACPTGIAHTFMAAENLEVTGKELGYDVKVETQGTSGAENVLTQKEIDEADEIILAVDRDIDESRFVGRKVLKCSVGKAVKKANEVINNAINDVGTEVIKGEKKADSSNGEKGIKSIYKHLMMGISYMLPIVVAGGILTAISFAFGIYAFQDEGSIAWGFYQTGAVAALGLMVPVLSAYIAHSIADKAGFAAGLVGGFLASTIGSGFIGGIIAGFLAGYVTLFLNKYIKVPKTIQGVKDILIVPILSVGIVGFVMLFVVGTPISAMNAGITSFLNSLNGGSIVILGLVCGLLYWDLGGPFSKILYAFAIGLISEGVYGPMAATMICGMVPPLGIAVATLVTRKMWTEEQRQAGISALFLGASYITEGAIPFAAENPIVVLPACMIGGAVGAITSLALGAGISAPHGGLFLLLIPGVITNVGGFLIALLAGTLVTAAMLIILKKITMGKTK